MHCRACLSHKRQRAGGVVYHLQSSTGRAKCRCSMPCFQWLCQRGGQRGVQDSRHHSKSLIDARHSTCIDQQRKCTDMHTLRGAMDVRRLAQQAGRDIAAHRTCFRCAHQASTGDYKIYVFELVFSRQLRRQFGSQGRCAQWHASNARPTARAAIAASPQMLLLHAAVRSPLDHCASGELLHLRRAAVVMTPLRRRRTTSVFF